MLGQNQKNVFALALSGNERGEGNTNKSYIPVTRKYKIRNQIIFAYNLIKHHQLKQIVIFAIQKLKS